MTAVVGILNKHAVAIAADSAVTISGNNGRKILNKANKVFTLSKRHPVGVMIYNSASFMGTPWETIIKIYRKQLADNSFPTLKEYQEDFIAFLNTKSCFSSPPEQLDLFEKFASNFIKDIIVTVCNENPGLIDNPTDEKKVQFLDIFNEQVVSLVEAFQLYNVCPEFDDYTLEQFLAYSETVFENILNSRFNSFGYSPSNEQIARVKEMIYHLIRAQENVTNFSGIIFTGFGEDEIYPQLTPVIISMAIDNRIRFFIEESSSASINNLNRAAIRPFAQTDVIDTILSGVAPSLNKIFLENFEKLFQKYNSEILDLIGDSNPELSKKIQELNTQDFINEYQTVNQKIKNENYIKPLMGAVSSLSKEDLAEMAESLIYLTYLKRRITFAEESVGGPVDVAVISKGDGFIWIKRKHYFDPKLNQYFFDNYFKS